MLSFGNDSIPIRFQFFPLQIDYDTKFPKRYTSISEIKMDISIQLLYGYTHNNYTFIVNQNCKLVFHIFFN